MKSSFVALAFKAALSSLLIALVVFAAPASVFACACGCGIFDVGTSAMFLAHPGALLFGEYDFMDQNRNWSGSSSAPAANNDDKEIRTSFFTFGHEFMLTRSWGFMVEVPYWDRYFKTTGANGQVQSFTHAAIGDIRIKGEYTGFSPDMSTGLTFGFKLPTGDYTYPDFDSDTEIGTGSTDLLLGGYHLGRLPLEGFDWFGNAQWDEPVFHAAWYRPGSEIDAAGGIYYEGWGLGDGKLTPLAEAEYSYRWRDSGSLADSDDSGYQRLLLGPGLEWDASRVRVFADVEFPIYQYVNGNQLIVSELYKLNISVPF